MLCLESPPLLVQLMDGPSAFTELIQEILDFVAQVLVLPPDAVQLLNRLIPSRNPFKDIFIN